MWCGGKEASLSVDPRDSPGGPKPLRGSKTAHTEKGLEKQAPLGYNSRALKNVLRSVAQLGRALRSGRRGRWFESSRFDGEKQEFLLLLFLIH